MKKNLATITVVAAAAFSLTACASYEGVAPAEFAKASCGAFTTLYEKETALVEALDALTEPSDEQKQKFATIASDMTAALSAAKESVAKNQPAVKEGADITAAFTKYFDERLAAAEAASTAFASVDVAGDPDAFVDASISLAEGISDSESYTFPFEGIENQKVVSAVEKEAACGEIVEVY